MGAIGGFSCAGIGFTSIGVILVLFILLVIVTTAFVI
ncbi:sporulation protein YjcZ [Paenibacillus hamazuiensis]|nr:sporulation protein YjcZ [Paenibacillus hamazuiensis]